MRRYALLVIAAVLLISPTLRAQRPATDSERARAAEVKRLKMARDATREFMFGDLSLPEAVRKAGGKLHLSAAPPLDVPAAADLATLTRESRLVVVGRPVLNPSVLEYNDGGLIGRTIVSRYQIQVQQIVRVDRDTAAPANLGYLTVQVPGGVLSMPEGVAEATGGPTLQQGGSYVFFLRAETDPPPRFGRLLDSSGLAAVPTPAKRPVGELSTAGTIYVLTGISFEGLLSVDREGRVRPAVAAPAPVSRQLDGRALSALVGDVERVK